MEKSRRLLIANRNPARPEPATAIPVGDSDTQLRAGNFLGFPPLPIPSPELEISDGLLLSGHNKYPLTLGHSHPAH